MENCTLRFRLGGREGGAERLEFGISEVSRGEGSGEGEGEDILFMWGVCIIVAVRVPRAKAQDHSLKC